jgi:hypothetical protein
MTRHQAGLLVGLTVTALAACSGNPMPGDSGYPYNMTGMYDTDSTRAQRKSPRRPAD